MRRNKNCDLDFSFCLVILFPKNPKLHHFILKILISFPTFKSLISKKICYTILLFLHTILVWGAGHRPWGLKELDRTELTLSVVLSAHFAKVNGRRVERLI